MKNSENNNEFPKSSPRIILQYGHQTISAMSNNHLAKQCHNSKSLDTKLAPMSLTYFKEERNLEIWNVSGHNNGLTSTTDTCAKPCNECEGDVLEKQRHKIYGVKKEALKTLNGQELDWLFQVSIWTAKDRAEKYSEIIKNVSWGSFRIQIAVYLAQIIDLPCRWTHFVLRELDSIFRKEAEQLPTETSGRDGKFTKSDDKPNRNGKSSIQKVVFRDINVSFRPRCTFTVECFLFIFLIFWMIIKLAGEIVSDISLYINTNFNRPFFVGGLIHSFGSHINEKN